MQICTQIIDKINSTFGVDSIAIIIGEKATGG